MPTRVHEALLPWATYIETCSVYARLTQSLLSNFWPVESNVNLLLNETGYYCYETV